MSIVADALTFD